METGRAERTAFDDDAQEPWGERVAVGFCPKCQTMLVGRCYQTHFKGWEEEEDDVWSDPIRVFLIHQRHSQVPVSRGP